MKIKPLYILIFGIVLVLVFVSLLNTRFAIIQPPPETIKVITPHYGWASCKELSTDINNEQNRTLVLSEAKEYDIGTEVDENNVPIAHMYRLFINFPKSDTSSSDNRIYYKICDFGGGCSEEKYIDSNTFENKARKLGYSDYEILTNKENIFVPLLESEDTYLTQDKYVKISYWDMKFFGGKDRMLPGLKVVRFYRRMYLEVHPYPEQPFSTHEIGLYGCDIENMYKKARDKLENNGVYLRKITNIDDESQIKGSIKLCKGFGCVPGTIFSWLDYYTIDTTLANTLLQYKDGNKYFCRKSVTGRELWTYGTIEFIENGVKQEAYYFKSPTGIFVDCCPGEIKQDGSAICQLKNGVPTWVEYKAEGGYCRFTTDCLGGGTKFYPDPKEPTKMHTYVCKNNQCVVDKTITVECNALLSCPEGKVCIDGVCKNQTVVTPIKEDELKKECVLKYNGRWIEKDECDSIWCYLGLKSKAKVSYCKKPTNIWIWVGIGFGLLLIIVMIVILIRRGNEPIYITE